jgi:tetratricopeptide (TPR) repeat protein
VRVLGRSLRQPDMNYPESLLRRADLAQALAGVANLLKEPGRLGEAEEIRRDVIRRWEALKADFPEDKHYRRNLVQSYLELVGLLCQVGRHSEAAGPYRKALELEPEDHVINNTLAWFLVTTPELGLRDAALATRLAKKAIAVRQESADYRHTLGVAHFRNGDDRAAIAELERAIQLRSGGSSFDWFFLAMAHWRLGDRAKAQALFDQAVQWMDKHLPLDDELRRFRAEAEALLSARDEREA